MRKGKPRVWLPNWVCGNCLEPYSGEQIQLFPHTCMPCTVR